MSAPVLFREVDVPGGQLGVATLNAPASLNSLSLDMIELLLETLQRWQTDTRIVAVWLEAEGDKAFCAGGDIVQLYQSMVEAPAGAGNPYAEQFFGREYRLDYLLHTYTKPVICWAQGIVMGGGLGLLSGCSHRVITDNARIAMPEITIGLFPDVGGSWFLSRMPGKTGLFLGLTGANINAADAVFVGLADRVIAHDNKMQVFEQIQAIDWQHDKQQDSARISAVLRGQAVAPAALAPSQLRTHFDLINQLCDADTLPQLVAQISACQSEDKWISRAVATLQKGCAQTAWLVWEAQRRMRHFSLAQVFRMEWNMAVQCALHPDFREGVRALLIDKDGKPQFAFTSVKDVPAHYMDTFFTCPVKQHPLEDL